MNLFQPRTFSTDWEVMVVDKLDRFVNTEKLMAFAGALTRESDHPVQIDWNALEFAMGINSSFAQLWERIQNITKRASQLLHEFDCDPFPAGAHPTERMFNASHIHVGTIHDESAGIALENRLIRYTPAFAALAANSPAAWGRRGQYKSYRVRYKAHGDISPSSVRDPRFAQPVWGTDAGPKVYGHPTVELRITDCASSRRFLAELATFAAAFIHYQGTQSEQKPISAREYRDTLTNRWVAARDGMQATFQWKNGPQPVAEILDEMLDACKEELAVLGVTRSELSLLNTMIQKRTCQADYVIQLAERYPDPLCLASAYGKLMRHWNIFDEYLETAPVLEPMTPINDEEILAEHANVIGEGTHFYRSRDVMSYPPPAADEMISQMIEQGLIEREVTQNRGVLLSRIEAGRRNSL